MQMMKRIIHIVHGKANPNGANGISRVVYFLNKYQKLQGERSEIWAFVDGVGKRETLIRDEFVTVEMFPRLRVYNMLYHPMIRKFREEKESISIVHFHMIWFLDKNILSRFLHSVGIPFVAMTHGTYSIPVSSEGKKRIAGFLFEKPFLNRAEELHALTPEEESALVKYGAVSPTFVIPNGIEPEQIPLNLTKDYFAGKPFNNKIKIGWIGVFREDKNLELIVKAFQLLPDIVRQQVHFIFMGPDHKSVKEKLIKLCIKCSCSESFEFGDAVYNREKYEALNSLDLYIMPSSSEGLSMAILDAMALGKPMILTRGCNMTYEYKNDFFQMCECSSPSIAHAIKIMIDRKQDWDGMGSNARRLIEQKYNWAYIVRQLTKNYKKIISSKK